MSRTINHRTVPDTDRRELLKALGVAGAVSVGGVTVGELQDQMEDTAANEALAPIGEAIQNDLAGSLDSSLIADQQAELTTAASELSVTLERGLPTEAPREEFLAVEQAGRPVYEHLDDAGFFESTTNHLPAFDADYLNHAVSGVIGSETLSSTLADIDFVGGRPVDVLASVMGKSALLEGRHWIATDEINRESLEYGDHIPPMTKAAAGGSLLWLEDIDQHLWNREVILTEDILADAVWHGQSMAAGFHLMAEGAKAIAAEDATLSDAELGSLLSTGFAVQAIGQALLPNDVYWVTEGMRDSRRTDLGRATK